MTTVTDTPESDIDAVSKTVNGLLLEQNSTTVSTPTTFDYDALERRIATQNPRHGNPTTRTYESGKNRLAAQTDPTGNTTTFTYVSAGQPEPARSPPKPTRSA